MLIPENNQTEIVRRQSVYKPPRSLSHWLIGQLLQTADALEQTIGKVIRRAVFTSEALSSTSYATLVAGAILLADYIPTVAVI
jgi:hypothetical protein